VKAKKHSHDKDNTGIGITIPGTMSWKSLLWVGAALVVLLYGTVTVFLAFDRDSHSVSDTVRPFLITMAPVWALTIAAARVLLRKTN
jgi:hypothetical protein